MTYRPKTEAERLFRWSVYRSAVGNRRRKTKKNSWYDDGWWFDGQLRKRRSLDREHRREVEEWT
jgi:hypothetical protein